VAIFSTSPCGLLLDLEKEVITFAAGHGLVYSPSATDATNWQRNQPVRAELAQVVIWIGYMQWMRDNGFSPPAIPCWSQSKARKPRCHSGPIRPANPKEPDWPATEFIVGNPAVFGRQAVRSNLGDEYVDAMFRLWKARVPHERIYAAIGLKKAESSRVRQAERGRIARYTRDSWRRKPRSGYSESRVRVTFLCRWPTAIDS